MSTFTQSMAAKNVPMPPIVGTGVASLPPPSYEPQNMATYPSLIGSTATSGPIPAGLDNLNSMSTLSDGLPPASSSTSDPLATSKTPNLQSNMFKLQRNRSNIFVLYFHLVYLLLTLGLFCFYFIFTNCSTKEILCGRL